MSTRNPRLSNKNPKASKSSMRIKPSKKKKKFT